jgi:hypothetical protein
MKFMRRLGKAWLPNEGECCPMERQIGRIHMPRSKFFISLLILLTMGLHVLPIIQKIQRKEQTLWPVLAWGMYRNSRDPGPIRAVVKRIIGITSQNVQHPVDATLVGLSSYALQKLYLDPMWAGDSSTSQGLADQLNLHREDPFVGFRLEAKTHTLTDTGIATEYSPVITYRVDR